MKKTKMLMILAAAVLLGTLAGSFRTGTAYAAAKAKEPAAALEDAAKLIEDIPTVQAFTDEAVGEKDINAILAAGINAPSAMNKQPWHFSVITDRKNMQKIADDMKGGMPAAAKPAGGKSEEKKPSGVMPPAPGGSAAKAGMADAPLAIVISCSEGGEFDAGLACQNMSAEAQLLGYGTKIISSPTIALNGTKQKEYRKLLGIPEDQSAVAVLLVGKEKTGADAVTGATERNPLEDMVTVVGK